MKATASMMSAHTADNSVMPVMTSSCLAPPQPYSEVKLPPRKENGGDATATVSKNQNKTSLPQQQPSKPTPPKSTSTTSAVPPKSTTTTKRTIPSIRPHQHLHGRTSLQPSQFLQHNKPIISFTKPMQQKQQIARFSPPLILQQQQLLHENEQEPPFSDIMNGSSMASLLASSPVMGMDTEEVRGESTLEGAADLPIRQAARQLSALCLTDLVASSVKHKLPQKILARQWKLRQKRKASLLEFSRSKTARKRHRLVKTKINYSLQQVQGIVNFGGQSCFLNSVLQALASLVPFLAYLERIVVLQQEQQDLLVLNNNIAGQHHHASFSEVLLENLSYLNCPGNNKCDAREVLYRIGKQHAQFRSRHGRAHVGAEQQDAQEVLQALVSMVIHDAGLDDTQQSSNEKEGVKSRLDFSQVTESSSNGGEDSVLSLSGFLSRIDLEQKQEKNNRIDGHGETDSAAHVYAEPNDGRNKMENLPREEKKQEDFELEEDSLEPSYLPKPYQNGGQLVVSGADDSTPQTTTPKFSTATRHMLESISTMTPSPLSGWIGSTLQCCSCNHVRPIQNAPFLDIPIVPTFISRYLSGKRLPPTATSCTLDECLKNFTSVERVSDVECCSCTIQRELASLEEETFMLRGAVETIVAKNKRRGLEGGVQVQAMRDELLEAEARFERLLHSDPDAENENLFNESEEDEFTFEKKNHLIRGDAKKCLLLTRMPTVLCLHVQRRYYDPVRNCMAKTLQHVDFPQVLDLATHCAYGSGGGGGAGLTGKTMNGSTPSTTTSHHEPILYKLQSIIEHRGNAHAGHYQTYRRAPSSSFAKKYHHDDDDKWVLVSDLNVTPLSWRDVKRCQAYMLFYEAI